jgi:AraC-like DNA-binding protein
MFKVTPFQISNTKISKYIDSAFLIEPSTDSNDLEFVQLPYSSEFIIINFDNPISYTSSNENDRRELRTEGAYLLGKSKNNRKFNIKLNKPVCIIKFNPCSFYLFSEKSPLNFIDKVVNIECPILNTSNDNIIQEINRYLNNRYIKESLDELHKSTVLDIITYVKEHFNSVTVEMISQKFALSKTTLFRYFKKYVGINLATYIKQLKFSKMMVHIYKGEYNATKAIECGFFDQSHFIKEFKKAYHIPPSHFQKELMASFEKNASSQLLFEQCYIR